jgi:cytochrome o ubiquinol oxidase operon protein cyoD
MHNKYPENESETRKGWLADHQKGLVFAFLLTLLPFVMVYGKLLSSSLNVAGIWIAGIIQILLQLHYFLGVGASQKEGWNLISLIFTFLIMAIFIGGTLWVMYTLNSRMM